MMRCARIDLGGMVVVMLFFLVASAEAALIDRGSGFIYDDVQDITWAQHGNINGVDTWANQVAWAAGYSQTHSVYGTFDDWRLPTTLQPDPSCSSQSGGHSYGYSCTGSEMGHLFNLDGIDDTYWGPFRPLGDHTYFWSGTEFLDSQGTNDSAWVVSIESLPPSQIPALKTLGVYDAMAVRPGDIAPIPEPSAAVLLGLGLSGLAASGRRRNRS